MNYYLFEEFLTRIPRRSFPLEEYSDKDIEHLMRSAYLQEIIYVSSPILANEISKMSLKSTKEKCRLINSFIRYLFRMSTRCTPFGLFAGCSVGTFSNQSNIRIKDSITRKTRLDMYYLCELADTILNQEEIRGKIKYYPNTSLYQLGNRFRYIEYKTIKNKRSYQISEVVSSIYLKKVLYRAVSGSTISELSELLRSLDIDKDDALKYINDLIDSQIISNELTQSVTGDDYFTRLINLLEIINANPKLIAILKEIQEELWKLDHTEGTVGTVKQRAYQFIFMEFQVRK